MDQPPMIQILYSDEALLVVNKPAGLSTLPDGYHPAQPHVKTLLEAQSGRLWTVHRLDKDTSGVLLFARTAEAHRSLNTQFETRQVSKVYHALVMGSPAWTEHTVDLPLRPNGDRQHRTVVDMEAGKLAVTHFKLLEYLGNACLLEAIPETGRTHQIRAHLSALSLYILGDPLYSPPKGAPESSLSPVQGESVSQLQGMALHARQLEVVHPISTKRMRFEAAYPSGWLNLLDSLRMKTETGNQ